MTTLIRDSNGNFVLPETLRQGQDYGYGVVNYDSLTGRKLNVGETTPSNYRAPAPVIPNNSYSDSPTRFSNKMTFTEALVDMLKKAQARNSTGQQQLNIQKNLITGQGINDAVRNFKNPLLDPNQGGALAMGSQQQFDPALEAIGQQQDRATKDLSYFTDLINTTGDNYQKEQDRKFTAEQNRLDRAASGAKEKATSNLTTDVLNAVQQFQLIKKTKNWKGVNPDDYQDMVDYFQKEYGIEGVAKLKTAMNALDLEVDNGEDTSGLEDW